jgi:short subunit dehydrogenase-like uncharacterized protein
MKKIDKIIEIIRENMVVSGSVPTNNISGGNIATFDPLMPFKNKKKNTIDFRRVPIKYKNWIKNIKK